VEEALRAKAAIRDGVRMDVRLLGPKAMVGRVWRGVKWQDYVGMVDGGGRRLRGHTGNIWAIAACEGRICSGSWDGTIRIWNRASLEVERTLQAGGGALQVYSLVVWEGHVIGGYVDGQLRVWSLATGECEQVLRGHTGAVYALALLGSRLVSGSMDFSIHVWARAEGAGWKFERILQGHTGSIWCLAIWQDKIISGSGDSTARVWDAATGKHDATLTGHGDSVYGLAVAGDRVYSASMDGTIRSWAAGTWSPERTVLAYAKDAGHEYPRRLAVSGGNLVSGSVGGAPCEVRGRRRSNDFV
jgi:WD40 repeat protein